MKKIFLLQNLLIALMISQFANAQNVGIGTLTPAYPLTLQTSGSLGSWGVMHTDGNVYLGSFIYQSGIAEFGTRSNHPLYFFTNNSDAPPALAIDATGKYVGINTTNPQTHLDVFGTNAQMRMTDLSSGNSTTISRYNNRIEIQTPDIFQVAMGTTANPSFIIKSNGYIGIGDNSPNNKLQIGTTPGFSGNDLAIGNGTQGMSFFQSSAASLWYTNTNFQLMSTNGVGGSLGLGVVPNGTIKLSIAAPSLGYGVYVSGTPRYALYADNGGIDLASGNIYVESSQASVGIGTNSPIAPLDVENNTNYSTNSSWTTYGNGGVFASIESIHASGDVVAQSFQAFSDARMK
ncbi:MAG: hypothetical protein JST96_18145, partial [Bacteroidetes bacterium]|nr:hypothetical protein [Bacteroidota bacterium]